MKDMYGQPLHILDHVEVVIDSEIHFGRVISPTHVELDSGEVIPLDCTRVAVIANGDDKKRYVLAFFCTIAVLIGMILMYWICKR